MNRSGVSKHAFDQRGRPAIASVSLGHCVFGLEKWFHAELVVLRGKVRLMREFVAFDATFP